MIIRPATIDDSKNIFSWRNDPITIAMFRTGKVEWKDHSKWFPSQLLKPFTVCLVGEHDDLACGVVWFHKNRSDVWETSVNLAPEYRGKKLSVPLLNSSLEWVKNNRAVRLFSTEIKNTNIPSIKMFEACLYRLIFQSPDYGAYFKADN